MKCSDGYLMCLSSPVRWLLTWPGPTKALAAVSLPLVSTAALTWQASFRRLLPLLELACDWTVETARTQMQCRYHNQRTGYTCGPEGGGHQERSMLRIILAHFILDASSMSHLTQSSVSQRRKGRRAFYVKHNLVCSRSYLLFS